MPDLTQIPQARGSEITLYKRCPQAWWWAYRMGWKTKRPKLALAFGELVHIALAARYCGPGTRRGPEPAETFAELCQENFQRIKTREATEDEVAEWTTARDLGISMLESYTQIYGRDEQFLIIKPEQTFSFDVPFPDFWPESERLRRLLAVYVGTFDGAYRDAATGLLWLLEHKTAKTIRIDHLVLDEQAGRYHAVAARALAKEGLIRSGERLNGIMYNFLRKGLPDPRPVDADGYATNSPKKEHYVAALEAAGLIPPGNGWAKSTIPVMQKVAEERGIMVIGERSMKQPSPLFKRHPVHRTRAQSKSQLVRLQTDLTIMERARRGETPITKTPHWSCSMCEFFDICKLHETSANYRDLAKVAYTIENPYADHARKSTDDDRGFEF